MSRSQHKKGEAGEACKEKDMDCITILAQAAGTAGAETSAGGIVPIDLIWKHVTSLDLVEALTFISFGAVCLFYGWRVFKILVTICFALLGLFAGVWANKLLIGGNVIWLAVLCVVLFALLSIPLMRWGVSILGAAAGGILTGGCWLALGLPQQYIWAGGLIGLVAGGMISFIIFKAAVMLFTSLGGSALILVGALAVIYRYMGATAKLEDLVFNQNWFLPLVLLGPMAAGMVLQYRGYRGQRIAADLHVLSPVPCTLYAVPYL
jgi:hypothetical protein